MKNYETFNHELVRLNRSLICQNLISHLIVAFAK